MEVEWGDADAPRHEPDRLRPVERGKAAIDASDSDGAPGTETEGVLTDPERLAAEHQTYRAIVGRDYGSVRDHWAEAIPELRGAWEKIKEKYGYEEHGEPTPPADAGTWHGEGNRRLDAAQNEEVDRGYARIREIGEQSIIPGVLSVEAEDPTRHLAGFDKRFKGEDRLKEKVSDLLEPPSELSAAEALGAVSDAVRFTYTYAETRYTTGVIDDVERLKARGFELEKLKKPGQVTSTRESTASGWNRGRGYASKCSSTRRPALRPRNCRIRRMSESAQSPIRAQRPIGRPQNWKGSRAVSTP